MSTPFRTTEARERGYGRGALRGRSVRRELRGVYVEGYVEPGLATRLAAARCVLPGDVEPEGVTVLQLLGVDVGGTEVLRLATSHPHQVRRRGVRVRRTSSEVVDGARRPEAAFVAAAGELDLVDLVSAGDWLVRLELASPEDLVREAQSARGRHVRHARRAAALVRRGVDSVQETRLRLAMVLAGLPEPEVNPVVTVLGQRVGRVDLLLRAWRTVLEYEGDQHRTDRRQWNRDVWRQELLAKDAYAVVRVTGERMGSPRTVVSGIHGVLVDRGYEGPAPVFTAEWRQLFATAQKGTRHSEVSGAQLRNGERGG